MHRIRVARCKVWSKDGSDALINPRVWNFLTPVQICYVQLLLRVTGLCESEAGFLKHRSLFPVMRDEQHPWLSGRDSLSHTHSGLHPPTFPWTTKARYPSFSLQMAGTQLGPVGGRKGTMWGRVINVCFIGVVLIGLARKCEL